MAELPKVVITSEGGFTATVYQHGAHVTSWKTPGEEELLFVSKQAIFQPPTAIRGGIPICWPQFGDMGPCKAQHGFARNSHWEVTSMGENTVSMTLRGAAGQHEEFPHAFEVTNRVTVGDGFLEQQLIVHNPSDTETLEFTAALHTYFRLRGSAESAAVGGLHGIKYLDNLQARLECIDNEPAVRFVGEVDRIYLGAPDRLAVVDDGRTAIEIEKSGFVDTVVWNPHVAKAAKMADFGDDEWRDMVCVEVAQAGSGAVKVPPQSRWKGTQVLSAK